MGTSRGVLAGVIVVAMVAVAGCSGGAPESRLDEYEVRAEEIHAEMLDVVSVSDSWSVDVDSKAQFGEPEPLRPPSRDVAFWTTWSAVDVTDRWTPAEAASVVGKHLLAEGWIAEPTVDAGNPRSLVVHRLIEPDGEWVVQVGWDFIDDAHRISLAVQSPLTVRGSSSAG